MQAKRLGLRAVWCGGERVLLAAELAAESAAVAAVEAVAALAAVLGCRLSGGDGGGDGCRLGRESSTVGASRAETSRPCAHYPTTGTNSRPIVTSTADVRLYADVNSGTAGKCLRAEERGLGPVSSVAALDDCTHPESGLKCAAD